VSFHGTIIFVGYPPVECNIGLILCGSLLHIHEGHRGFHRLFAVFISEWLGCGFCFLFSPFTTALILILSYDMSIVLLRLFEHCRDWEPPSFSLLIRVSLVIRYSSQKSTQSQLNHFHTHLPLHDCTLLAPSFLISSTLHELVYVCSLLFFSLIVLTIIICA
jgi:hypothetical protein